MRGKIKHEVTIRHEGQYYAKVAVRSIVKKERQVRDLYF